MMLVGLIYATVSLAVGCAYVGFFRAFDETPMETAARAAFVGLLWPLWAVLLLALVLGF